LTAKEGPNKTSIHIAQQTSYAVVSVVLYQPTGKHDDWCSGRAERAMKPDWATFHAPDETEPPLSVSPGQRNPRTDVLSLEGKPYRVGQCSRRVRAGQQGIQGRMLAVFSTGQSVRPEGGRRWTALSGPVRSFSKLALRPGAKDYKPRRPPPSTVKHVSCQETRLN